MHTEQEKYLQTYTFHVHGMHCNSCVLLTESEIGDLEEVEEVHTNLATHTVTVFGRFGDKTKEEIAEALTVPVQPHGYTVSVLAQDRKSVSWGDYVYAVPIALGFLVLFVALQKMGIVNLIGGSGGVTYGTAFGVGIIASLSTCMAVVGGLVLSMSATFAKEGDKLRPQLMFHGGRILSFFLLGGLIGGLGAVFTLNTETTFVLNLLIGVVMLILGINLLDTFPWAKKLQPSMPSFIAKHAHGVSKFNHTFTPFLVGVVTFFLPCGFTQSMQLYTLTTGSFLTGGLTMLAFALGTLPVLALISFSSYSITSSAKSGVFFKTAGLVVIMFALFNLLNSLVVLGVVRPVFSL